MNMTYLAAAAFLLECTPFGRTGGWFGLSTQGEELSG